MSATETAMTETAILGGGCFWCLEAVFKDLRGVQSVMSGYAAGHVKNPTYHQVCSATTGHAEVVRVVFDPAVLDFSDLLRVFFTIHDPTTKDRQGNDVGPQYRSGIYWHRPEQAVVAQSVIDELNLALRGAVVTELTAEAHYSRAEDYHQHYFANHPGQGYCAHVVAPKVAKFKASFARRMRR